MTTRFHRGDLPADYQPGPSLAIDTETLGLNPHRDRLCVVQLSKCDGSADVVQVLKDAAGAAGGTDQVLADATCSNFSILAASISRRCFRRSG